MNCNIARAFHFNPILNLCITTKSAHLCFKEIIGYKNNNSLFRHSFHDGSF